MWRHGDVLIAAVEALPPGARKRPSSVLMQGELTGHAHRIEEPGSAELWEVGGQVFVRVTAERARVIHEEHRPIMLPRGTYRIWQQREYTPEAIRRVMD